MLGMLASMGASTTFSEMRVFQFSLAARSGWEGGRRAGGCSGGRVFLPRRARRVLVVIVVFFLGARECEMKHIVSRSIAASSLYSLHPHDRDVYVLKSRS